MVKNAFINQNNGHLTPNPPKHLARLAGECWRRIVPFLDAQPGVNRIDSTLIETYCTMYEIYRNGYAHVREHGQTEAIYKTVVSPTGEIGDKDFVGFKINPNVKVMNDSIAKMNMIGSELGLNAKSRAELAALANDDNASADDFKAAMAKMI